jgi:hypothetical protein
VPITARIYEDDDVYAAVDARTESLQNLRELGPPDLVYLVKQPKANSNRQVRSRTYPPPQSNLPPPRACFVQSRVTDNMIGCPL